MSLFYLGKSPIEDIPTSGHVRHNQAKSSLEIPKQRTALIEKKHKSEKVPQRKLASKNWRFYNMDEEQIDQEESYMDTSLDQSGSISAREKKGILQLKNERILKQQVLFQEIEHNIREKREEDETYHPVSPIVKDRFAISETMSNVLAKHREKFGHKQNEVEEILRERDIKMYNNIGIEKGQEQSFERKISLPRLMRRQGSGGNLSAMGSGNKRPSPIDNEDDNGSRGSSDEGGDDLVPSYCSLHPLEQEMKETIDFPADLVEDEELYVEDSDYLDYKRRLDDGRDSSDEEEETKMTSITRTNHEQEFLVQKRKKAQNFGQRWFLHPSQWSIDMDNKNKIKREKHDHSEKVIREKLKNLSSSKLFKMHLIKTNNAVPDWLADCNIKNQHPLLSIDYDKSSQSLIPPIIKSMHNDNLF